MPFAILTGELIHIFAGGPVSVVGKLPPDFWSHPRMLRITSDPPTQSEPPAGTDGTAAS